MSRDPESKNPTQQSVYVDRLNWEAVRELAHKAGKSSRSAYIVSLIEREKVRCLGPKWRPKT